VQPLRILLTAGILAYAAAAAGNGFDRMSRDTPALERLVPGPLRAQADRSAALTRLVREQPQPALRFARAAVARDPIDPDATALLGAAHLALNDFDEAAEAFRIAARFGWRNLATQGYWYEAALGAGDYKVAADRADAILRAQPRLVEGGELLEPLEVNPTGRAMLAGRLALKPSWLEAYLRPGRDAPAELIERREGVVALVDPAVARFGCSAVSPFVSGLIEQGRRTRAQTLWNAHCPEYRVTGPLADPGFDQVLSGAEEVYPFSWRLLPSGDVSIQAVGGGQADRSLLVANSASTSRMIMRQLTALPAGLYRFRVGSTDQPSAGAPRLVLSWACAAQPPFPRRVEGDALAGGQILAVEPCDRQQLGIWLRGNEPGLTISHIEFERIR